MKPLKNIPELLRFIEDSYDNPKAFNYRDQQGNWHSISTKEMLRDVRRLALGLLQQGLEPGEKVGIMARACPGWTLADLAVIMAGGVVVPLFHNMSDDNLQFEVEQTELKMLFVSGEKEWAKYQLHQNLFQKVVSLDPKSPFQGVLPLKDILEEGDAYEKTHPTSWDELMQRPGPDDLATIIYTSGSTGQPKGAQITQSNLTSLLHLDPMQWNSKQDKYLSFLPLAHVFARVLNYIIIQAGVPIYYLDDIKAAADVAKEVKPTVLVLVPRLLEKVFDRIQAKAAGAGYIMSRVVFWAIHAAESKSSSWWMSAQRWLADKLVYKKLRQIFGGEMRVIISGGARLNPDLSRFFINAGYPIFEGWGMTESCPISVNYPDHRKIGTVGPALGTLEVKTSEGGELLVRGANVMKGYYKRPDATKRSLDEDGWLHTGDRGRIDEDGFITIEGRIQELFKSSTGKWVAPVPIEQHLTRHMLIDHALVVAEGRSYVTCLLFPDPEALANLKASFAMSDRSDEEFLESDLIRKKMQKHIAAINQHLNNWEQVRAYRFILETLTPESGDLTPTLKIRRELIMNKYEEIIQDMYEKQEAA